MRGGPEEKENFICCPRVRSRAWITTAVVRENGSISVVVSGVNEVLSGKGMPGVTCERISYQSPVKIMTSRLVDAIASQVFVICNNGDWVRGVSKVLAPFVQGKNDSKEFSVIHVIVPFSWHKCFGEICARVKAPIVI